MGRKALKHKDVAAHYLEGNIKLLSEYVHCMAKNNLECLKCGNQWQARYDNFSSYGVGCPKCAGNAKHTHEFVAAKYLEGGIKLLSEYVNNVTKNSLECLICSHKWQARYCDFSMGNNCPKCAIRSKSLNHEEVEKHYLERGIKLLSHYVNSHNKNSLECLICSHKWQANYNNFSKGVGCPSCYSQKQHSKYYTGQKAYNTIRKRLKLLLERQYNHTTFDDCFTDRMIQSLALPIEYIYAQCKTGNHVDHIIPLSWFDCTDYTQMKHAYSEFNLRYLPYSENVSRSNRITNQEMRQLLLDFPLVWLIALEAKYTPDSIRQVIFDSISNRSVNRDYHRQFVA